MEYCRTNDDGVYVVKADRASMTRMREYETPADRKKVLGFYETCVEKLDDGRMDLPAVEPGVWPHNQWVVNKPGATVFMPVVDVTKDMIKLILNLCDSKAGRYAGDGGYFIVDDRDGMRPCGNQAWVDNGFLSKGIRCVKDICGYILDTFGKFPATVDPIQLTLMIQAHHLDLDFYDAHMKPGACLQTHRHHFRDWHGGVEPRKRD